MELRLLLQCYAMSLFVINVMRVYTANSVAYVQSNYVRHSLIPARLSQKYANVDSISLLACAALCSIAHYCFGINFHQTSSQCELINGMEYFGEYHSSNDGWKVYSKFKGESIFLHTILN